jgi:hypothetical protein
MIKMSCRERERVTVAQGASPGDEAPGATAVANGGGPRETTTRRAEETEEAARPEFFGAARGEELGRCRTRLAGGMIMRIVHIGHQEVYLPAKSPIDVHMEASSSTVSV